MGCAFCNGDHTTGTLCPTLVRTPGGTEIFASPRLADSPGPGTRVGPYRLIRRLGEGGMGTVFLAEHTAIQSRVAVKFLHEHLCTRADAVARFRSEARAVGRIGHPNIVNVFDIGKLPPDRDYLVMEYLEGKSLAELASGPMPAAQAIPLLIQVCDGLEAAHAEGVIHRDLKPENLLLVSRGRAHPLVKILDFGIAKLMSDGSSEHTCLGMIIGTPRYMAPEQAMGGPIDARTDLYALGVIAYRLATGRLPYEGDVITLLAAHRDHPLVPPSRLDSRVPEAWSTVICRALAKSPGDRFGSAAELRTALERALVPAQPAHSVHPGGPFAPPRAGHPAEPAGGIQTGEHTVWMSDGGAPRRMVARHLSRGGLVLPELDPQTPLFSRLDLVVGSPRSRARCTAEVVRRISAEQGKSWGMSPGVAIQFVSPTPEFRFEIERLLQGGAGGVHVPAAARPEIPSEPALELLFGKLRPDEEDPYRVLGLDPGQSCARIRERIRALERSLEPFRDRALPQRQRERLQIVLARVKWAASLLFDPARRALFDANRGDFRGVAHCLSDGLTATRLESLRAGFLAERPGAAGKGHVFRLGAEAHEAKGERSSALESWEAALRADPLCLELHRRYWTLERRISEPSNPGPERIAC